MAIDAGGAMTTGKLFTIIGNCNFDSRTGKTFVRFATVDQPRPENLTVDPREDRFPSSTVTISMLISESTYKLITAIERLIRWFNVAVIRPCRLHFRWLHW